MSSKDKKINGDGSDIKSVSEAIETAADTESVSGTAETVKDVESVSEAADNETKSEAAKKKGSEKAEEGASQNKNKDASGKGKRLRHGALSVVFTVIFVAAVVLINIIFNMVLDRFDFSADLSDNSLYTIDGTTADYIRGIDGNISIIVAADETSFENAVLSTGQQYGKQVSEIIKSFASANPNIDYQFKDLDSNPAFYSKYGATLQSGSIIVESEKTGRNTIITANDYLSPKYYYQGEEIDYSQFSVYYSLGYYQYGLLGIEYYAGAETSLLTSIMNVTNENPVNVAVLEDDYGATAPDALVSLLEANAYIVETFKLSNVQSIDSKYDYVIIHAPIYDFENDDIDKLDRWLDNGGQYGKNLFYAAASTAGALPRLNQYLQEWGLSMDSGYVYQNNSQYKFDMRPTYQELSLGETDYSEGVDVTTKTTYGDSMHPITLLFDEHSNYYTTAVVSSYSGAVVMPYDASMGEFDPSSAEETGAYVVVAESEKMRFEGTVPYSSRVFLTSGHYMLDSAFLQAEQVNNSDVFLNIFNKTSGREAVQLSITPKSYSIATFEISAEQAKGITIAFAVVVPIVIVVCGIVVIVRRKRR